MKTTILRTTCILASLIGPAFSANAEALTARIPFDFVAGSKTMPAGEYRFTMDTSGILVIHGGPSALTSVIVAVQADSEMSPFFPPSAVFEKNATTSVLSRVTLPSGSAYLVPAVLRSAKSLPLTDGSVLLSRH